jgi:hypothetical protein
MDGNRAPADAAFQHPNDPEMPNVFSIPDGNEIAASQPCVHSAHESACPA